jgi:phospholipase C
MSRRQFVGGSLGALGAAGVATALPDSMQKALADGNTNGPMTMGYYTRADLPFHYALADSFTICDNYHCSVFGPTNPNRLYGWTGMIDPPA